MPTAADKKKQQRQRAHDPVFDVRDASWSVGRPGMLGQRVTHRLVLVRHGESETNAALTSKGEAEIRANPPLTLAGQRQARDVAAYLRQFGNPYTAIELSPLTRAHQTAWPTLCWAGLRTALMRAELAERWSHDTTTLSTPSLPTEDPALTAPTWVRKSETGDQFRARVDRLVERLRRTGTVDDRAHTLMFTHSLLIDRLLNAGNPSTYTHLSNGSITVVDLTDGGGMHVHLVNHTAHLSEPTGHHTAFTTRPTRASSA